MSLMCSFLLLKLCPTCFVYSYLDGFRDRKKVVVQLLFRGMLLPGFVQCSSLSGFFSLRLVSFREVHLTWILTFLHLFYRKIIFAFCEYLHNAFDISQSVMVAVVVNDTGEHCTMPFAFPFVLMPLGKAWLYFFSPKLWANSWSDCDFLVLVQQSV